MSGILRKIVAPRGFPVAVMVVTTHEGVPREFYGAKLIRSRRFPCPWYQKIPLSLALSPGIISEVANFKPFIIHPSSPGVMARIKWNEVEDWIKA